MALAGYSPPEKNFIAQQPNSEISVDKRNQSHIPQTVSREILGDHPAVEQIPVRKSEQNCKIPNHDLGNGLYWISWGRSECGEIKVKIQTTV